MVRPIDREVTVPSLPEQTPAFGHPFYAEIEAEPAAATWSGHPATRILIDDAPIGSRFADAITAFMGSWKFIVVQSIVVCVWLVANMILLIRPFDPYPFILLNLAFSLQAAYAAPLILLATNRAAIRDRLTLEHAVSEADIEEEQNERLLEGSTQILQHVAALETRILEMEKSILAEIVAARLASPEPD
jgi:uncharacterized membrane protein